MADKNANRNICENRRARHEYHFLETFEAGISLQGTEVKSLRMGKGNLQDAYAKIEDGECWLLNMHISPYEMGNIFNKDPLRPKKLLLHKYEINKLLGKIKEKGFTLVPLQVYFKDGKAKIEMGLCRGKKLYDKRDDIAKRDAKRDMDRKIKDYNK